MLWAWERPEDLRTLDPGKVGVAYLCQTLALDGGRLSRAPRMQPLLVAGGTRLMAVTRIEVNHAAPLNPSEALREEVVRAVLGEVRPGVHGIQIDFDARLSERPFYAGLLRELRARMDPDMPLSMTALASWSFHDDWTKDLPVDEAVPMCFDMGSDTQVVKRWLGSGKDVMPGPSRLAFGVGLWEPLPRIPGSRWNPRRIYVFSHKPWSPSTVREAMALAP